MKIETFQEKDRERWDEFVLNSDEANFCHLLGWGML